MTKPAILLATKEQFLILFPAEKLPKDFTSAKVTVTTEYRSILGNTEEKIELEVRILVDEDQPNPGAVDP